MSQIRSIATIITALALMAGISSGQSRPRPKPKPARPAPIQPAATTKRPVTINLTQGDSVSGNFLRADAETVQVEVERGRLTIKLNDVASMVFSSGGATAVKTSDEESKPDSQANPDSSSPAARKAYAALRKIADAAQIGLPYLQYGSLLIEVRQVVDESLRTLPDGTLKTDIIKAVEAYTDAGKAWSIIQTKGVLPIATEPGATLMKKYEIKPNVNALGQPDNLPLDASLNAIWAVAGARLNNIALQLNQ
jgi:hypothetical protein